MWRWLLELLRPVYTRPVALIEYHKTEDEMAAQDQAVKRMIAIGREWLAAHPAATVEDFGLRQHWAAVVKQFDTAQCALAMTALGVEFVSRMTSGKQ